jgi:hypothetical protein
MQGMRAGPKKVATQILPSLSSMNGRGGNNSPIHLKSGVPEELVAGYSLLFLFHPSLPSGWTRYPQKEDPSGVDLSLSDHTDAGKCFLRVQLSSVCGSHQRQFRVWAVQNKNLNVARLSGSRLKSSALKKAGWIMNYELWMVRNQILHGRGSDGVFFF